MSKKKEEQDQMAAPDMPINILAQYIRDLSFENPNAPESLRVQGGPPEMDINIGMDARRIESDEIENLYEVVLNIRAAALREEDAIFVVELQYGITVALQGIPQEAHHPLLFIEVPRLAFPYARQIISNTTVQGGYPPLMLNPIDFQGLYLERFKDEIAEAENRAKTGSDQETVN
ncbi:MAG: protein-export chaperone SecB [Alphaproteobacteria bacterium]|nr:protein-export chaperone SecB [Alphaproteobacteria bacterium]